MSKIILKDIKIKNKNITTKPIVVNSKQQNNSINLNNPIQEIKQNEINRQTINTNPDLKKYKPEPDLIKSTFENNDDTELENYIKIQKAIKRTNKKRPKIIIICTIIILGIIFGLYYFNYSYLTISPKKTKVNVNYSINQSSWNNPIKSQIMVISDTTPNVNDLVLEQEKDKINKNLNSQKIFNTPKGYLSYETCSSGVVFTNEAITADTKNYNLVGRDAILILNKQSLLDYIYKQGDYSDSNIKDISSLKCSLNTSIANYKVGSGTNGLSYNISGEIIFEKKIDNDKFKNLVSGSTRKNLIKNLNLDQTIDQYTFITKPFNFSPILPKSINKVNITYKESNIIN